MIKLKLMDRGRAGGGYLGFAGVPKIDRNSLPFPVISHEASQDWPAIALQFEQRLQDIVKSRDSIS